MRKRVVIALGGNAILQRGQKGTYEEQMENVRKTARQIVDIILDNEYEVVITHGNGPQVGTLLLQQDAGEHVHGIPAQPMDVCGAMSQGQIGYMIQQAMWTRMIPLFSTHQSQLGPSMVKRLLKNSLRRRVGWL